MTMEKRELMAGDTRFVEICHRGKDKTSRKRAVSRGNIVFSVLPSTGVP